MMRLLGALALALVTTPTAACQVDVEPVSFGIVEPDRRTDGVGRIIVRCDAARPFVIGIGPGQGGSQRRMAGPDGDTLRYELYLDPGRNFPWGDDQTGGSAVGGVSDGVHPDTFTIYGRIPPQGGKRPGIYTDSLLVTLSF
jgi:spore coat protein U-like protein